MDNVKIAFENSLYGARIIELNRICELVRFVFEVPDGRVFNLHVLCFLRVFDSDGTLAFCTQNMRDRSPTYRKKRFKKYDWTVVGATVFDDAIADYRNKLFSTIVSDVEFIGNDIKIKFNSGMWIDVLVTTTKYDDKHYVEDYRFFENNKIKEHYFFPKETM